MPIVGSFLEKRRLKMGVTRACFRWFGKTPSKIHVLLRKRKASAIICQLQLSFNAHAGKIEPCACLQFLDNRFTS